MLYAHYGVIAYDVAHEFELLDCNYGWQAQAVWFSCYFSCYFFCYLHVMMSKFMMRTMQVTHTIALFFNWLGCDPIDIAALWGSANAPALVASAGSVFTAFHSMLGDRILHNLLLLF